MARRTSAAESYGRLRARWTRPVSPRARRALEGRWRAIDALAPTRPVRSASPALRRSLERLRMDVSPTLRSGAHALVPRVPGLLPVLRFTARLNWRAARARVERLAAAGAPLTLEQLCALNARLTFGLPRDARRAGELRGYEMRDLADGGHYLPAKSVPRAMRELFEWLERAERRAVHPIELAAGTYQRLVSIHPFADGNGRTARLAVDWLLQLHGLPPACFAGDGDELVAVRGRGAPAWPADKALHSVTAAVERTLALLSAGAS